MNDITRYQQSLDKVGNIITPTGISDLSAISEADLPALKDLLVQMGSSVRFSRIDLCRILLDEIDASAYNWEERNRRKAQLYAQIADDFGISPDTLRVETSIMNGWAYERRKPHLTVEHYRVANSLPNGLADEFLDDASSQMLTVRESEELAITLLEKVNPPPRVEVIENDSQAERRTEEHRTYREVPLFTGLQIRKADISGNSLRFHADGHIIIATFSGSVSFRKE